MDSIRDVLRKRLSIQHRGKNMIGSIAMNEIKSYLNTRKIDSEMEDEIITWYVRHNKIFLKTIDQNLKIQIFKNKSDMIGKVNQRLEWVGYKTGIVDIILK